MHIAVAGNIGCGKTTLTNMLAKHYGWEPRFESVEYNPYLSDFYADMARWSFNLQVYFLNKRFKDVVEIGKENKYIIQDRTIYEDARIFAPNLHEQGFMSDRDFENYRDLFDLMMSLVKMPDLLIYVRASIPTLVAQIQKRGRGYEQSMKIDYLQGINRSRSKDDERNLIITLTDEGLELKKQACKIPAKMGKCVALSPDETRQLYNLLYKLLECAPSMDEIL